MKIFEVICQFDSENYDEFNIITLQPSLGVPGMNLQEWYNYIIDELPYYYNIKNPDEEDNNKHWMKYKYDNIYLFKVRSAIYTREMYLDFEGYLIFGVTEVNPLYNVLIALEKTNGYSTIRNIMAIVAEYVVANSKGVRVY